MVAILKRDACLSAFEAIQVLFSFCMFTIALIGLVVKLHNHDEKNNRLSL
ncbi:MAG: putative holin-like toxin [Lactococcus raffinolactis]